MVRFNSATRCKLDRQPSAWPRKALTACLAGLEFYCQVLDGFSFCLAAARHLPPVDHRCIDADRLPTRGVVSGTTTKMPDTYRVIFG